MRRFISKFLEIFHKRRARVPPSRSYIPTIYDDTVLIVSLRPRAEVMERKEATKPSTERLDGLVNFRIHPNAIIFTPGGSHKSGGQADVVRATFRRDRVSDKQVVAVKKLRWHGDIEQRRFPRKFVDEVEIMAGLSHENIVKLVGFVEDLRERTAWIVLSWEPNGNVSEFLASGDWEIPERISLIKDTFQGVMYLHTRRPPICHGDLKSLNILVSSSYRAVINDFGSARTITKSEDVVMAEECDRQMQGTPTTEQARPRIQAGAVGRHLTFTGPGWSLRWAPPEVVNGERLGLSTDIWAAGWICWEVMTNKLPFHEVKAEGVITLKVIQGEVPSTREDVQLAQIIALCSLMEDCWTFDPKARPNIVRCWDQPSVPPSGDKPSDRRVRSPELLLEMGRIQYKRGELENATSLFQEALSLAESRGNQTAAAPALRFLGHVYRGQAKYAQAEESYSRSHEICARISDDLGQAYTLDGLGFVYGLQSKYTQAGESYSQAYKIFARIGDDGGLAHALLGMGELYRTQFKYSQAEPFYIKAQETYARIGYDGGYANTFLVLGDVYRGQFKDNQAKESYTRAQEIYVRVGDDLGRANVLQRLGLLFLERGRNVEAAPYFLEAKQLYARTGRVREENETAHWFALVSPKQNSPTP